MTTKSFLYFFIFFALTLSTQAQNQLWQDGDSDLLYKKEITYGINFNTNGGLIGGLSFKYAKALNRFMYHSFSVEGLHVKHPKENRLPNLNNGGSFIPGKQNFLFLVRPTYGRELVLFQKAKRQGIQVNALANIGPAIGVVAPYLINYRSGPGIIRTEQYDPNRHQNFDGILGNASLLESLSQSDIRIGGTLKAGVSFEFGTFKTSVTGFEAGFAMDAFPSEIVIMPLADNRSIYTSAYLTFYYGIRK